MTPDELKSAREKYGYIPARLVPVSDDGATKLTWKSLKLDIDVPSGWETGDPKIRQKYSSLALDMFHHELLNSERDDKLMHGLLSVVFWGFASGTNGRVHSMFALAKSRAILRGRGSASPRGWDGCALASWGIALDRSQWVPSGSVRQFGMASLPISWRE